VVNIVRLIVAPVFVLIVLVCPKVIAWLIRLLVVLMIKKGSAAVVTEPWLAVILVIALFMLVPVQPLMSVLHQLHFYILLLLILWAIMFLRIATNVPVVPPLTLI
jgi:hypothetical protein